MDEFLQLLASPASTMSILALAAAAWRLPDWIDLHAKWRHHRLAMARLDSTHQTRIARPALERTGHIGKTETMALRVSKAESSPPNHLPRKTNNLLFGDLSTEAAQGQHAGQDE